MKAVQLLMMNKKISGWDLSKASYDNVSFSIGGQDGSSRGLFFKSDGTKMYVMGNANDRVYQYSLSTAWDLSTASYDSVSFSVSSQDSSPVVLCFKSDGTKMYVVGWNNKRVYQYSLSTAWSLSNTSYDNVSFSFSSQTSSPNGLFFKSDGTKMYMVEEGGSNRVYQYSLSTAWSLSSGVSYDNVSFSVGSQESVPRNLFFKSDGTKMYLMGGYSTKKVHQYSLSTAWSLSNVSYDTSFSVSQDTEPSGLFFKSDGTKMYVMGNGSDSVYQYSLT
jgi:DNA-binding beta-propeller fold protein YncE